MTELHHWRKVPVDDEPDAAELFCLCFWRETCQAEKPATAAFEIVVGDSTVVEYKTQRRCDQPDRRFEPLFRRAQLFLWSEDRDGLASARQSLVNSRCSAGLPVPIRSITARLSATINSARSQYSRVRALASRNASGWQ